MIGADAIRERLDGLAHFRPGLSAPGLRTVDGCKSEEGVADVCALIRHAGDAI